MSDVSLTLSKEVVLPIVESKIKGAIMDALGGSDEIVAKIVDKIFKEKVNAEGKVSQYSSDNKFDWFDIAVTSQIQAAVKAELGVQISKSSESIKNALISQLQSKKGANQIASAMIAGLENTFKSSWASSVEISINQKK